MTIDPRAFERYRRSPNEKTTLPRLFGGVVVIVVVWMLATLLVILAGVVLYRRWQEASGGSVPDMAEFVSTPAGVLTALGSFAGIWIGTWIAMRFLHREPLSALLGNSRRVSWNGFVKGFVAVVLTSLLSEILLYLMQPGISRGTIGVASWLVALLPITLLTFLQTSSEELLFRGYLPRGLAKRFTSPIIWAVLPVIVFTSLHWSSTTSYAINACVMVSIAAFAAVLMLMVYATGNLGASFGAHLGNNLTGFLLISHQQSYNAFALFSARPLEGAGWTAADATMIAGIGVVSSALTALLLIHPRSPLKVDPDLG